MATASKAFDPLGDIKNNKRYIRASLLYAISNREVTAKDLGIERLSKVWRSVLKAATGILERYL